MKERRFVIFGLLIAILCSCSTSQPINPLFALTERSASKAIERIESTHPTLARPLIIVGGFHDFGVPASSLAKRFQSIFQDDRILAVSFGGCHTFAACKERLINAVEKRFPSSSLAGTISVDVVASSMGGLVSRYAASSTNGKRLVMQRLFTIATPHQGSKLAQLPTFEPLQRDMRPKSNFLKGLARTEIDYEIFPYVRLRDEYVAMDSAAPSGQSPLWVPYDGILSSHNTSFLDLRFIADIAARLSGETPFASTATNVSTLH